MKKTEQEVVEKIEKTFNTSNFKILKYNGMREPFSIQCLNCGNIMNTSRCEGFLSKKNFCKCVEKHPISEKSIELKHKFQYWYKNSGYKKYEIIKDYTCLTNPITVKCLLCGSIHNRKVESLLKDNRCLSCERKVNAKKTNGVFQKELSELYNGEYINIEEYINAETPILFKHNICGKIFKAKPKYLLQRKTGCPICRESKGEQRIRIWLDKNGIEYITQYRLDDIKKAPYDFYIPTHNLLIEFQGRQHYEAVPKFGGVDQLIIQQEIDIRKKKIALQNNKELLIISYTDIDAIEEILVQRLVLLDVATSVAKSLKSH